MGCCGNHYGLIVLIMVYALIQAFVHIGLMVTEIMIYQCVDILSEKQKLLYTVYFANTDCLNTSNNKIDNNAERTSIFAIIYLILDTFWICLTVVVLSLASMKNREKGKYTIWAYIFLDVIMCTSIILDVVTLILYATDDKVKIGSYKEEPEPYVVMMLISGRGGLLIINIIAVIGMIILTAKINNNTMPERKQRTVPLKPPKPVIKNPRVPNLQEDNIPRVEDWYRHYEDKPRPDVVPPGPRPNQNHNQYERERPREDSRYSPDPYSRDSRVSNDSYSNGNSNMVGNHTNVMVNGVPSGTLRRQLPWSYVHQPGAMPRKQLRRTDVEPPPVPVPDYTMRLNRNQRLEDMGWSQYPPAPPVPPPKPPQRRTPYNSYY